jgi:hypothetical protein
MGIASVIHQIAIHGVEAKTAFPWSDRPSNTKAYLVKANSMGPRKSLFF